MACCESESPKYVYDQMNVIWDILRQYPKVTPLKSKRKFAEDDSGFFNKRIKSDTNTKVPKDRT